MEAEAETDDAFAVVKSLGAGEPQERDARGDEETRTAADTEERLEGGWLTEPRWLDTEPRRTSKPSLRSWHKQKEDEKKKNKCETMSRRGVSRGEVCAQRG